jgi:hypothetical protein
MKRTLLLSLIIAITGLSASAQTAKSWTEWTKKDAEKMLNDSAWGQTQTTGGGDTSASTSAITKTEGAGREDISRSGESGATMGGGSKPVNYRVRFLTAKPIREAFARTAVLSQPNAAKEFTDQLQGFIDRDFGNYLVVTLSIDSADAKLAGMSMMALGKASKDTLKDKVYLERKDGKRLALSDYKPPINDGMGAKFVFERTLDGQPFLAADSDFVKFNVEVSEKMKFSMKFKVTAMMYNGKLEY